MNNYGQNCCTGCGDGDILQQNSECCNVCYTYFCTVCGHGCECIWRNAPNESALKAHAILRRFVFRYIMSEEKCEVSYCNAHVPIALLKSCDMVHTVFGGRGVKCRTHICPCELEDGFDNCMTMQCYSCNRLSCIHCANGCECDTR